MSGPVRLSPSPRVKPWGRTSLAPWFPNSDQRIGEVWYESEQELPLLIKLLFTSDRLSIQLHPDDGEGVPRGKTEMWHILDAEPGAMIGLGFREPITRERLLKACRTREIEDLIRWLPVKAGETYFTPAHTVHAIGAGIVLCEIQQNSDVTYRLWDYGSDRELHIEQAIPIADLSVHRGRSTPTPLGDRHDLLVRSKHFVTEALRLDPGENRELAPQPSQLLVIIEGSGAIGDSTVAPGEVWLLPETAPNCVRAKTALRVLRTFTPSAQTRTAP